jgi:hypothetical protein
MIGGKFVEIMFFLLSEHPLGITSPVDERNTSRLPLVRHNGQALP